MGGLSSPGSMNGAVRAADSDIAVDPLGPDSEDSRVTIMGEGERLRRDATDEKGDLEREEEGPAYSGMGETRTVRSDITGTRKRALIFSHLHGNQSMSIPEWPPENIPSTPEMWIIH
jgi:hypothetical protein